MRRIVLLVNIFSLLSAWLCASQTWASADIIESGKTVSTSGLEGYPQLAFLLATGILILWLSRYMNSVFSKFLTSAVVVFLIAAASPVWFDSASGSLSILGGQISKLTGVSDWLGQGDLLKNTFFNHLMADLFVIATIFWFLSLLFLIWAGKPGQERKEFVTRIDNLPSW